MKDKIKLSAVAIASLLAGSAVTVAVDGIGDATVTPIAQVRHGAVQMDKLDPAFAPLMKQLTEAGAAEVECRAGVISNKLDRTYCWDGKTAGFLLGKQTLEDLAGAIEAAFPGLIAEAAYLQIKDGALYLSASGK
jgi:hypothetical protein